MFLANLGVGKSKKILGVWGGSSNEVCCRGGRISDRCKGGRIWPWCEGVPYATIGGRTCMGGGFWSRLGWGGTHRLSQGGEHVCSVAFIKRTAFYSYPFTFVHVSEVGVSISPDIDFPTNQPFSPVLSHVTLCWNPHLSTPRKPRQGGRAAPVAFVGAAPLSENSHLYNPSMKQGVPPEVLPVLGKKGPKF